MKKEMLLVFGLFLIAFITSNVRAEKYHFEVTHVYNANVDIWGWFAISINARDIHNQDVHLELAMRKYSGTLWNRDFTESYLDFIDNERYWCSGEGDYINGSVGSYSRWLGFGILNCKSEDTNKTLSMNFNIMVDNPPTVTYFNGTINILTDNSFERMEQIEERIYDVENTLSSQNQRLSTLESWKQTIDSWKTTVTTTLSGIATSITSLLSTTSNHETRITSLENQNLSEPNITIQDYWKYLGSSDRKNIVCGIAKNNHLTYLIMEDLDYECTVTYRQTSGGERASCRCSKL